MIDLHELKFQDYIEIIAKRKTLIMSVFLTVFLLFVIYVNVVSPRYTASLVFRVDRFYSAVPTDFLFSEGQQQPGGATNWSTLERLTDYEMRVISKPILRDAMTKLGLLKKDLPEKEKETILRETASGISAKIIPRSNMMALNVTYKNAEMSARLANEIFDVFKRVNMSEKNREKHNVTIFIEDAFSKVMKKLQEDESRMRVLIGYDVGGVADALLEQLDISQAKRAELLESYTQKHPEVMALSAQISDLKTELNSLPEEEYEYSVLKRDVEVNRELYNSLKTKFQEAQIEEAEKIDNIVLISAATPPLSPSYPNKLIFLIVGLLAGVALAVGSAIFFEEIVETSIKRVEDLEALAKIKIVGVIPFFHGRSKIETNKHIWERFFARKPAEVHFPEKNRLITQHSDGSIFLEAFRVLGTNVQAIFATAGRIKNKTILVTSSHPSEGKTLISSNLSIALAQMGYKTLLIDLDLRRSSMHKLFGFKEDSAGFTDILLGKCELENLHNTTLIKTATDLMLAELGAENVLKRPWINNLNIITAGHRYQNPIHLFNSDKFGQALKYLNKKYDVVIIDSLPVLTISETSLMLPLADGILLVYRVGQTSRFTLKRAKAQIESIKGKGSINGLILNNAVPQLTMDPYYSHYQKYYTRKEQEDASA